MDNPEPMNTTSLHIYQPSDPYFADAPVSIAPVTGDYEAFLAFFQIDSIHIWCHIMVYNLEVDYEYDRID